ncbi:hypothetical protein ACJW31_05G069500 [Castanea mollissima]
MAEALVCIILEQLSSITTQGFKLVLGVDEEVQKLASNFQLIQMVLNDAEKRQVKEKPVKLWIDKLKDISYDVEDVLDEWNTAILKSEIEKERRVDLKRKVSSIIPSSSGYLSQAKQLFFHYDFAHTIKELNGKVDEIVREKEIFRFELSRGIEEVERPKSTSFVDVSNICGRDKDRCDLISNLLGKVGHEVRSPHVISLLGMGGIGKTTLAQLVYNDHEVKAHFRSRMWVCVSEPFDNVRVAKAIIQELGGCSPDNNTELETLLKSICNLITGKKFFLVLDDVWTEDYTVWEPFKLALQYGAQGSRILVTTRKERVAEIMSAYRINLEALSDEDCWLIFRKIAFFEKSLQQCKQLEDLGREIAKKCKGLPLAARTLGSLMRFKKSKEQWKNVLDSSLWILEDVEKGLFAPLLLSYYELPFTLKRCFSYCAIFPKDYVIYTNDLVKLWMAQGYLNSEENMDMELEIIGEEYFENLAMRSFFQDFEKDECDDTIRSCKMHDIVHDFAQLIMKNECFSIEFDGDKELGIDSFHKSARHLSLTPRGETQFPVAVYRAKNLRTLLPLKTSFSNINHVLPDLLQHLTCLRALNLSCSSIDKLPDTVEKLIHLRFIDLSYNRKLKVLPETICNLCNLQTLNVSRCHDIEKLPQGMSKLIKLRHLVLHGIDFTKPFPMGIGKLSSLRTLEQFVVSGRDDSGGCKLEELKLLNYLQGALVIKGLGNVIDVVEAENAHLKEKTHLRRLRLNFDGTSEESRRMENNVLILNVLDPHPILEHLQIYWYEGRTMFPNWIMSLTKLKELEIIGCKNLNSIPPLGKLPFLELLEIRNADSVKKVGVEFLGIEVKDKKYKGLAASLILFPNLKSLKFWNMKEWEEWGGIGGLKEEDGFTIMPCLLYLEIVGCPKLKALPHFFHTTPLKELCIRESPILKEDFQKRDSGPKIIHIPRTYNIHLHLKEEDH